MSVSRQEEIIAILWPIAAILCFGFGFSWAGWSFAIKSMIDTICSIRAAVKEIKKGRIP